MALKFTSVLGKSHREQLEELMFFHPQQGRFRDTILECIESFGLPRIVVENGRLRIALAERIDVQTLYAVLEDSSQSELVGTVVYTRHPSDELLILHIAIKEAYTGHGPHADRMITFAVLDAVCNVARQIKGVNRVRLAYARGQAVVKTVIL